MRPTADRRPGSRLRAAAGLLAAVALVVVPASPAVGEAVATADTPAAGDDVTEPIDVVVRVGRQPLDPRPAAVDVRFVTGTTTAGPHELGCVEPDGCDGFSTVGGDAWGGVRLDPASLPCNGAMSVLVSVDGADPTEVASVVLAAPPRAVGGLRATTDGRDVVLSWTPSTAPDVRLTVQRREVGSDDWTGVVRLPGSAASHTDRPGPGVWEHRVIARRGDGRVDGEPVAACEDTEDDLQSTSVAVRSEVAAGSAGGGAGGTGGAGGAGGAGGGGTTGPAGGGDGSSVTAPPPATRSADASTNVSVSVPGAPGVAPEVDEGFEPTLDYTGVGGARGADDEPEGEGGLLTSIASRFGGWDSLRVVGAGVLLMAGAGALRRWRRVADEDD